MSAQESLSIILNQPGFPRARPLSSDSKVGITEERATELINYQRNLEELRNTLSQVDSLLAEPPTPEIAAKCASLLGYVAAIDLPQEVKNQEAGRYPPQVQEQVHRALETQGTSTTRSAEAAAYGTAIMQRVAEEAQVRIQLEAKAAYEESVISYHRNMQAIENDLNNAVELFKNSPYSVEGERKLMKSTWEGKEARLRETEKNCRAFEKNYKNMSPEEQKRVMKEREEESRYMEEQRRRCESEAQRYRQLAAKESDPNLRAQYMALSRAYQLQGEGWAECKLQFDRSTQRAAANSRVEMSTLNSSYEAVEDREEQTSRTRFKQTTKIEEPVFDEQNNRETKALVAALDLVYQTVAPKSDLAHDAPVNKASVAMDHNHELFTKVSGRDEEFAPNRRLAKTLPNDEGKNAGVTVSYPHAEEFLLDDITSSSELANSKVNAPIVPAEKGSLSRDDSSKDVQLANSTMSVPRVPSENEEDKVFGQSNIKDMILSHSAGAVKPDSSEMVHVFATTKEFSLG